MLLFNLNYPHKSFILSGLLLLLVPISYAFVFLQNHNLGFLLGILWILGLGILELYLRIQRNIELQSSQLNETIHRKIQQQFLQLNTLLLHNSNDLLRSDEFQKTQTKNQQRFQSLEKDLQSVIAEVKLNTIDTKKGNQQQIQFSNNIQSRLEKNHDMFCTLEKNIKTLQESHLETLEKQLSHLVTQGPFNEFQHLVLDTLIDIKNTHSQALEKEPNTKFLDEIPHKIEKVQDYVETNFKESKTHSIETHAILSNLTQKLNQLEKQEKYFTQIIKENTGSLNSQMQQLSNQQISRHDFRETLVALIDMRNDLHRLEMSLDDLPPNKSKSSKA